MSDITAPRVFISYSHDSELHKDWVRQLAERLTADGVSIVLDQWEIGPGHDVTAFMEKGLTTSDWVIIVCTEDYVHKVNTLKGGVGYERMIVTAEVARDLETTKFIPILRAERSEKIPAFLGSRIYVDLRGEEIAEPEYDRLLRSIHRAPKYSKPAVGQNPYSRGTSSIGLTEAADSPAADHSGGKSGMKLSADWTHHWHRTVHEYCGNTLYFILLRFTKASIFLKPSVLNDLQESLITDYKIFHLYSPWDVLIRVWADKESIESLRGKFAANHDIHVDKRPEFLLVEDLEHMPEGTAYAEPDVVNRILRETSLSQLRDVQEGGEAGGLFDTLKEHGMLLEETVRFDPERIQFFITISSSHQLGAAAKARIQRMITREWSGIFNRSVYMTPGASIQAILKGQADEYYAIHRFLQGITDELSGEDIATETMLVANCDHRDSKKIDFGRAEAYVIDNEFQRLVPRHAKISFAERLMLQSLFAGVWSNLHQDRHNILKGLIRAKATNSAAEIGAALSLFFPPFENSLKRNLVAVIVTQYGPDWQTSLDDLKKKEKIDAKSQNQLVFGDLCKLYKRIINEKIMIDIDPLSEYEFSKVMDMAPLKRNEFAHGEETVLRQWDDWFSFCSKFVPIHHRLITYLEKLNAAKLSS